MTPAQSIVAFLGLALIAMTFVENWRPELRSVIA